MTATSPNQSSGSVLVRGLTVQMNVIGALILRELHTRYGRDNIGYLWMLLEPGLLASAVAALHFGQGAHRGAFSPVAFALGGYCSFIILRSIIGRAESALESNQPLLFHRVVTVFDMVAARSVLEIVSTIATLVILLAAACAVNLAEPPARPLDMLAGLLLLSWLAFALAMSVCAATYVSKAVAKFVHPTMYITMPASGAFFLLDWIPQPYRDWLSWSPLTQIFELIHTGQFESVQSPYFHPEYVLGWCLGLTFIGLLALRIVRRHVHLS